MCAKVAFNFTQAFALSCTLHLSCRRLLPLDVSYMATPFKTMDVLQYLPHSFSCLIGCKDSGNA